MNKDKIQLLDTMKIAKYLFYTANDMSNLKLQKFLYFAYKEYYIENKKELFKNDFEAWIYGPVLPEIYKNFHKILGDNDFENTRKYFDDKKEIKNFLNKIIEKYKVFSTLELVEKTHKEKAWMKARQNLDDFEPSTTKMNIIEYIY